MLGLGREYRLAWILERVNMLGLKRESTCWVWMPGLGREYRLAWILERVNMLGLKRESQHAG